MEKLVLEPASVQSALECIYDARPLHAGHPLQGFLSLRIRLQQPEAIGGIYGELYTLTELIKELLLLHLPPRSHNPLADLHADFLTGNSYTQSYSLLYHRFLRPDLNWTLDYIATQVGLVRRSLQRREDDGIAYLTQDLISYEIEQRREQRLIFLKAAIPYPAQRSLYGREWIVEQVISALPHQPVLVTGLQGVGKTSIVAEVAHQYLSQIEHLYWIKLLPSVSCLNQVMNAIAGHDDRFGIVDLKGYLATYHVLLVLEKLQPEHLSDLAELRHARIIGTSRQLYMDWPGAVTEVPPLSREEAQLFWERLVGNREDEFFSQAFSYSGGIPGVLQEYAILKEFSPQPVVKLYRHFASVWKTLRDSLRSAWVFTFLLGEEGITLGFAAQFFDPDNLMLLVSHQVLSLVGGVYVLSPGAASVVDKTQSLDEIILEFLNQHTGYHSAGTLMLMLIHGLADYLSEEVTMRLFKFLREAVSEMNLWTTWEAALLPLQQKWGDLPYWKCWLNLETARLGRWQGLLAENKRSIQEIIQQAGRLGFFDVYATGLLELSIGLAYEAQWQEVIEAAQEAEMIFARIGYSPGVFHAKVSRARGLVKLNPQAVLSMLEANDPLIAVMACEAALALGQAQMAVEYASLAIKGVPLSTSRRGRILALMATTLWQVGERRLALDYQQQAINVLHSTADLVGLVRAYNNLGVLYHNTQELNLARKMWQVALELVLPLQDANALEAIRFNLALESGRGRTLSEY